MDQFFGFGSIVDNQSVQVSGTSDFEFGLSERFTFGVDFLVDFDGGSFDVSSSGQF